MMFLPLLVLFSAEVRADVAGAAEPPPSLVTVPADGRAGVPLNPLILVPNNEGFTLTLEDPGAAIVETTASATTDAAFNAITRLSVADDLRPATTYAVVGRFANLPDDATVLTRFTTGGAADDTAPGDLAVDIDASGFLTVSADEEIPVVDVKVGTFNSVLLPVADNGDVGQVVFQDTTVSVVALDAAGNSSAPVAVEVEFDGLGASGCGGCGSSSSSSAASSAPFLGLALWSRRRRVKPLTPDA